MNGMDKYAALFTAAVDISSNDFPENKIMREEILKDLTENVARTHVDPFRHTTIETKDAVAVLHAFVDNPDVYWIDYCGRNSTHFKFWINKSSLRELGKKLRVIKGGKNERPY